MRRYAGWSLSNHKTQDSFSVSRVWSSTDFRYVSSRFAKLTERWCDFELLALLKAFFSVTGTLASFDFSKSTFICQGGEKKITYALISGRYRHERPVVANARFLSSSTNLHGCISRCCSLKWCKHALVSQHNCYGAPCTGSPCLYRKQRSVAPTSRYVHKTATVTAAQSAQQGTIWFDLLYLWFVLLYLIDVSPVAMHTQRVNLKYLSGGSIVTGLTKHNFQQIGL